MTRTINTDRHDACERLRGLTLSLGSGGNLAAIGEALLGEHPRFGWTEGACEALRARLLWLLGGDAPEDAGGGAHEVAEATVRVVPRIDWLQTAAEIEAFAATLRESLGDGAVDA